MPNEEWAFTLVSKDKAKTKLTPIYIDAQNNPKKAEIRKCSLALTVSRGTTSLEQSIENSEEADLDVYHALALWGHLLRDMKRSYRETTERMK